MLVDIAHGQKTGHFLDQQENRGRIRPYVPGRSVLDLCCCTGGFSIHAALYGAKCVEAVDASQEALEMVQKNARLNGVTVETTCANVFDLVRQYADAGRQFDTVICDPPAFAKSKRALSSAYRGYKELNLRSMKLVKPGGFLITWLLQPVHDAGAVFPDASGCGSRCGPPCTPVGNADAVARPPGAAWKCAFSLPQGRNSSNSYKRKPPQH